MRSGRRETVRNGARRHSGQYRARAVDPVAVLCDLDGVVWLAHHPIRGSVEAVARLRASGRRVVFVTNNSSARVAEQESALAAIGIPAAGDVLTSATAAAITASGSGAAMLSLTNFVASSSVSGPFAAQPIIVARRSSSIGSGEGGEAAISTTPTSPGNSPCADRAARIVAILPPMLWPTIIHGPSIRARTIAAT